MTATTDEDPRYADLRERDARLDAKHALLTVPSCPDWCTDTYERDNYPSVEHDERTFLRHHTQTVSNVVRIVQEERNLDNVVTLGPVWISVEADDFRHGDRFDVDGARALASELVAAAYLLDEITAGQR